MGVDLQAVLQHHLGPAEVPLLPQTLSGDAAPRLADAVERFVQVTKRPVTTHEWRYEEPWHGFFLDDEGRETEPPPFTAPESRVLYPLPSPNVYRRMSVKAMWDLGEPVTVSGPAILNLHIARHCAVFSPVCRWGRFQTDPNVQVTFRRMCHEVARLLNAPQALYVPDSFYAAANGSDLALDHQPYEAIVAWLREHVGAPTLAPESIGAGRLSSRAGDPNAPARRGHEYYIDTFTDLGEQSRL